MRAVSLLFHVGRELPCGPGVTGCRVIALDNCFGIIFHMKTDYSQNKFDLNISIIKIVLSVVYVDLTLGRCHGVQL